MKYKFIAITITLIGLFFSEAKAQESHAENLKTLYIKKGVTLHFRSPETINYVDISTDNLIGDIPLDNIAKVKCLDSDTLVENQELGIVSIIGETFLSQYRIVYSERRISQTTEIEIQQEQMRSTKVPEVTLSPYELRQVCLKVQYQKRKFRKVQSKKMGLKMVMNNIYTFGDYIFLDLTFENDTKLKYYFDVITFRVEDKKIYKATNNQSILMEPVYTLYKMNSFERTHRNVFVFKQFTFPNNKVLKITLNEKQMSGRTIDLLVDYNDLLNSDTF